MIQKRLATRGTAPGLVHILSVMEECVAFRPWHDKTTHRTSVGATELHRSAVFVDQAARHAVAVDWKYTPD